MTLQGGASTDALALLRRQLREQLRQRVDARGLTSAPRTERRVWVREEALEVLRQSGALLPQRELTQMVNEISDEVVGFGPIEFLLKDPEVTEVTRANGPTSPPDTDATGRGHPLVRVRPRPRS